MPWPFSDRRQGSEQCVAARFRGSDSAETEAGSSRDAAGGDSMPHRDQEQDRTLLELQDTPEFAQATSPFCLLIPPSYTAASLDGSVAFCEPDSTIDQFVMVT